MSYGPFQLIGHVLVLWGFQWYILKGTFGPWPRSLIPEVKRQYMMHIYSQNGWLEQKAFSYQYPKINIKLNGDEWWENGMHIILGEEELSTRGWKVLIITNLAFSLIDYAYNVFSSSPNSIRISIDPNSIN